MVHPHIVYCLPAYSFTSAKNRSLIFKKQKQCIRLITKSNYNAHTEPLFYKTQILPFEDLVFHQKLQFMHSLFYNYSAAQFPNFILNNTIQQHRFSFRNDLDFFVPRAYVSCVQKMPLIDFPKTWNSIDQSLKDISSKQTFKINSKLELLDKYCNFRCSRAFCISCFNN